MKVRLPVDEVLAESRTTGGKTAGGAEGLAQGPDQDVWRDAGLVTEAAPTRPQPADGMGLVDNKGCPVFWWPGLRGLPGERCHRPH